MVISKSSLLDGLAHLLQGGAQSSLKSPDKTLNQVTLFFSWYCGGSYKSWPLAPVTTTFLSLGLEEHQPFVLTILVPPPFIESLRITQ